MTPRQACARVGIDEVAQVLAARRFDRAAPRIDTLRAVDSKRHFAGLSKWAALAELLDRWDEIPDPRLCEIGEMQRLYDPGT